MKDVSHDKSARFWDAMEDVDGGMLGLATGPLIPMTPQVRDDGKDGKIYFLTADGNSLYVAATEGPKPARFVVADRGEGIWADIEGELAVENDKALIDEFWSPFAAAWFDDGKEDPDVRLMSFTPKTAEATLTDDNPLKFFYEMAKANVTDDKPDLDGWKGKIVF
ncbi:pyridoxamine 5'-phosphate oxidase family protein [Pseudooctadecabacter jejudonensis]|uniref:General stress protein FMN-binding split barrel domain-containing protein n=1 Tax=Pseudooctadecabacter jejudonensis TaxID=1391910 RepID=A0A1Y5T4Y1_9RHOB|nr:pyridoxamine 5'-phosphate oxidase family protein [Pseudooctadecabacter jejudonensis]SLN55974.1 hypothetical protein PSJ8397_02958 [Pseudooctadecabacter jejudonensis]